MDPRFKVKVYIYTGVWGLGFGVWGLGFGVWGLGFGVWGLGFGVWGLGFGVWGLGLSWFGSFLAIFITSYLTVKTNSPLLMAPFGATSVVIFSFPDSPLAQPRNVIGGNLIGALVSLIFLHFLGSSPVTMAMAVATSIALMQLTGTVHPASGGIALVVMMTKPNWLFLLTPTLEGSIILVLCAVIFNNLAQERIYPKYWL